MRLLLALVTGAIYPLGFAPFGLWPLMLVSVLALFWLVDKTGRGHSWLLFSFAVGKYAVGASWVYVSMNVYGGAPPILAGFLVVLFVIALALFYWPGGWLYERLRRPNSLALTNVMLFAAVFIGIEWLLTWLFTGFPWLFVGHALLATPLDGFLPVVGTLGAGFLAVVSVGCVYLTIAKRSWVPASLAAVVWVAGAGLGQATWVEPGGTFSAALIQGNLDQARKWLPEERIPNVRKHLDLTKAHWDADLIVWPEAAITMFDATDVLEYLDAEGKRTATSFVTGIPLVERFPNGRFEMKNSALALGTGEGRFAKQHLVPFGEYVPLEDMLRGLIEFFDLPMSSTTAGSTLQPNLRLTLGGQAVEAAMAICYEVAYGESMRRHAATAGVVLTISNDTWFGTSIGPLQHMQIAQVRAAENGRWLLRATNNGVTALVNHQGEIMDQLPQFEAGTLRGRFDVMQGRTPYSHVGDWPVLVALVGCLGLALFRSGGILAPLRQRGPDQ
jgi:apolipoprotein N-acyltransferase